MAETATVGIAFLVIELVVILAAIVWAWLLLKVRVLQPLCTILSAFCLLLNSFCALLCPVYNCVHLSETGNAAPRAPFNSLLFIEPKPCSFKELY